MGALREKVERLMKEFVRRSDQAYANSIAAGEGYSEADATGDAFSWAAKDLEEALTETAAPVPLDKVKTWEGE